MIYFILSLALVSVVLGFLVIDHGRRLAKLSRESNQRLEELQHRVWRAEELGQNIEQDLRLLSERREGADTEVSALRERITDLRQETHVSREELRESSDRIQAQESATRSRVDQLDRRLLATRRSLFTIAGLFAESELLLTDANPDTAKLRELVASLEHQLLDLKSQVESLAPEEA